MIVKLTSVTLTPKTALNRIIYDFSATVTEVDTFDLDTLSDFDMSKINLSYKTDPIEKEKEPVINNIFDFTRFPTSYSAGGCTMTNNMDGALMISGSGSLTSGFHAVYDCTHQEMVNLLKAGTIYFDCKYVSRPYFYMAIRSSSTTYLELKNETTTSSSNQITQEMLDNENLFIRFGVYGAPYTTINPSTITPLVYQEEA